MGMRRTIVSSTFAALAGLALAVMSFRWVGDEAIEIIDAMVMYDAAIPQAGLNSSAWQLVKAVPDFSESMARTLNVLGFVGLMVVVSGILGIVGAATMHKGCVCSHVLMTSCISAFVVVMAARLFEAKVVSEPLIQRQVTDLCEATTYIRLGEHLPCAWAEGKFGPALTTPCGDACQLRIRMLRKLDGCEVLPQLCKSFLYEQMGTCNSTFAGMTAAFAADMDVQVCQAECDKDIACASFAHAAGAPGRCVLLAGLPSRNGSAQWTAMSPVAVQAWASSSAPTCYRRMEPSVLRDFTNDSALLVKHVIMVAALLIASVSCQCCFMYDVSLQRRGVPTGTELVFMLLCPCCASSLHKRLNEEYFEELSLPHLKTPGNLSRGCCGIDEDEEGTSSSDDAEKE